MRQRITGTAGKGTRGLCRLAGGVLLAAALAASDSLAGTYSWANAGGGAFSLNTNWNPNGSPGSGDTVYFNLNATYQVDFTGNASTADAGLNAPGGATVTLAPTGYTWASGRILAGYGVSSNVFTITGGTVTAGGHFALGAGNGSGNSMTVSGTGARLTTTSYDLGLGYYIDGGNYGNNNTLTASGGGVISSGRTLYLGAGTATGNLLKVTGLNSQILTGSSGISIGGTSNTLRAESQGAISANGSMGGTSNQVQLDAATWTAPSTIYLGGASSTVTIGNASTMSAGDLRLGNGGSNGTYTISGGSVVTSSGHAMLGYSGGNGNSFTITGTNSLVKTTGYDLGIGNYNNQAGSTANNTSVTVSASGELRAQRDLFIGAGATTGNQVTVTGSSSKVTAIVTSITVGGTGGSNGLTVQSGATASAPNFNLNGNSNYMTINGSTATASSVITTAGTNNTFTASNGATVTGDLYIASGSGVTGDTFTVSGGSTVIAGGHARLGYNGASGNTVTVTGSGSLLKTTSWDIGVGNEAGGGTTANNTTVTISAGGKISAGRTFFLGAGTATGHVVTVTGLNSVLEARAANSWDKAIAIDGTGNTLRVQSQGQATSTGYSLLTGTSNQVVVDDGSWTASNIYTRGASNTLTVSNGGTVTGSEVRVGDGGSGNTLNVTGGTVTAGGHFYIGSSSGTGANVNVTGPTAQVKANAYDFHIGESGTNNTMTVSGGGTATCPRITYVGEGAAATGNRLVVTGVGSQYTNGGNQPWNQLVDVGNATAGNNTIQVSDSAVLDTIGIVVGAAAGNAVTNTGGVYQFRYSNPTLTPGAGGISLTGGTISFKGVTDATISNAANNLQNITFSGNNTFMLNNASTYGNNQSYTFDSVANTGNPRNYQKLSLVNGTTGIPAGNIVIATGGAMLADSTTATLGQSLTNRGALSVTSTATLAVGGTFTQTAGTATVDGTLSSSNALTFSGGTLLGTGHLAGTGVTITSGATVSPGHSPGALTVDNLTLQNNGIYDYEGRDLIAVTNTLRLVDDWTLRVRGGLTDGGSLVLFTFGTLAATPDLMPTLDLSQLWFTPSATPSLQVVGNTVVLLGIQIPEPGTGLLVLAGALAGLRRRSARQPRGR